MRRATSKAWARLRQLRSAAALAAAALMAGSARGQAATWLGGAGTWYTDGRWSTGLSPDSPTTDVFIDGSNPLTSAITLQLANPQVTSIHNLTVDAGDSLTLLGIGSVGNIFELAGSATINGSLNLPTATGGNSMIFNGTNAAALSGTGVVSLSGGTLQSDTRAGFTLGAAVHIAGNGQIAAIGANFTPVGINFGTISATVSRETLEVDNFINAGVMEAVNGGVLSLDHVPNAGTIRVDAKSSLVITLAGTASGNVIDTFQGVPSSHIILTGSLSNAAGVTLDASRGTWEVDNATITGGSLRASRGQVVTFNGTGLASALDVRPTLSLTDVTLDGGTFLVPGPLVNASDALTLADGATLNLQPGATLAFGGTGTIGGVGEVVFSNGGTGNVNVVAAGTLSIGANVSLHGGSVTLNGDENRGVANYGTVSAEVPGGVVAIRSSFTNRGTLRNVAGSAIWLYGSYTQTAGAFNANGLVVAGLSSIIDVGAGVLSGTGSIAGSASAALLSVGGTLSPGATLDGTGAIGTLTVDGNVTLTGGSHFLVELSGTTSSDALAVGRAGTSGGNLTIAPGAFLIVSASPGQPSGSYVIATYGGALAGAFDSVTPGYDVSYATPGEVIVTSTPEPGGALTCAAAILWQVRRRRRRLGCT